MSPPLPAPHSPGLYGDPPLERGLFVPEAAPKAFKPEPACSYVVFNSLTLKVFNIRDVEALRTARAVIDVLLEDARRDR